MLSIFTKSKFLAHSTCEFCGMVLESNKMSPINKLIFMEIGFGD